MVALNTGQLKHYPIIDYMKNCENEIQEWIKNNISKFGSLTEYGIEYVFARYKYFMLKSDKLWCMTVLRTIGLPITTKNMIAVTSLSRRAQELTPRGKLLNQFDIVALIQLFTTEIDLQFNKKEEKKVWDQVINLNKDESHIQDIDRLCNQCFFQTKMFVKQYTQSISLATLQQNIDAYFHE